jgi:precorrin-2 dehydrogenase/sirohydrochlorin ferrochelatase
MGMRTLYPMMVNLTARRCLVVGGGRVAERKVTRLLECGAQVEVVSPTATPHLAASAASRRIRWRRRSVRNADLSGAFLVFAATDDPEVNRDIARRMGSMGGLVNVVDDPEACSFLVPSVLRRGELTIALSTGGGSPALAKKLRQHLEQTIGPEYAKFLRALRLLRQRTRQTVRDPKKRQAIYRRAVASNLFEAAARGDSASVAAEIDALVKLGPPASPRA